MHRIQRKRINRRLFSRIIIRFGSGATDSIIVHKPNNIEVGDLVVMDDREIAPVAYLYDVHSGSTAPVAQ